jgi:predicted DNA-binding protein with PD1-like motif
VHTTAEILMAELPGRTFSRRHDDTTGYPQLVIEPRT